MWFPTIYDIKFMMRACKVLKGGLQDVADDLGVSPPAALALNVTLQPTRTGDADRPITSSRLGLAPHGIHVLQDA